MKKNLSIPLTMLFLVMTISFVNAQSQNAFKAASLPSLQSSESALQFSISLPAAYSSQIVRENTTNASYFHFKKSDGTTAFLFQVSKIEEGQWVKIKEQLSDPIMLAHKNGFVYYALTTDKSHIKGADSETYAQVYGQIRPMIGTITITE